MMDKDTKKLMFPGKDRMLYAAVTVIGGCAVLIGAILFSVAKGASNIPVRDVLEALFRFESGNKQHLIIVDLRLPRIIASVLVGASFAVSGALMQGTTRNPLADSGLMGLNAGAGFALAVSFAFFSNLSYLKVIMICFAGAALGAFLVNGIASIGRKEAAPMRLVLAGAAVSALLLALSQGIAIYYNVSQDIMFWTVGGVSGSTWEQVKIMIPFILSALLGAVLLSRSVTILSLGDEVSRGLGLNTAFVLAASSVIVLILAGISVSVVGSVGFVGLIVPHIVRRIVGPDYRLVIPAAAVLGALLMVLADLGARMLNPPFETPVGAVIAVIGVPFFLYLTGKQRG